MSVVLCKFLNGAFLRVAEREKSNYEIERLVEAGELREALKIIYNPN